MPPKTFYLSFDGSPNPPATDRLLAALDRHGVKASFFMEGRRLETEAECARRVRDAGHDIGNHSYNHPEFDKIPLAECIHEVQITQDILEQALGLRPTLLRPPAGKITDEVVHPFLKMGFDIALWSFSVRDWEGPDAAAVAERILAQAHPGAIIAGHDRVEWLTDYLDLVIPALRSQGYVFKKISESGRTGLIR